MPEDTRRSDGAWRARAGPAPGKGAGLLGYIFAGIALGSIYAIAASGIVVTYVSSGVLNFAFGSLAYFLARFYYFLNTQHGCDQLPARVVSVFVAGPALAAFLYLVLFPHL